MWPTLPSSLYDSGDEVCGCDVNEMLINMPAHRLVRYIIVLSSYSWRCTQIGSIGCHNFIDVEQGKVHLVQCRPRLSCCYRLIVVVFMSYIAGDGDLRHIVW
jgi:hypothetical protein